MQMNPSDNPSYNPSFGQASVPSPSAPSATSDHSAPSAPPEPPEPSEPFATPSAPSVPSAPSPSPFRYPPINEGGAREFLTSQGWPQGLQNTLLRNLAKVPIRFFIFNNDANMPLGNGKRIVSKGPVHSFEGISSWGELALSLEFHAKLAHAANAPSQFCMLRYVEPILIGGDKDPRGATLKRLQESVWNHNDIGMTLCQHIHIVTQQIAHLAPKLRAMGQKAVVVIFTHGGINDGNVTEALRPLKSLPVWVVIRLFTEKEEIVDYWNNIDKQLVLDMDVLVDHRGEAKEIRKNNSWLTYGEPLHRLREFGIPVKEIDLLDEKKLSLDEIHRFIPLLFDGRVDDFPHPEVDLEGFKKAVSTQANLAGKVVCPVTLSLRPWVDMNKIRGEGGSCVTM